jgi:hypothetical protein
VTEGGARLTWVVAEGAGVDVAESANAGPLSDTDRRAIAHAALNCKLPDTVP